MKIKKDRYLDDRGGFTKILGLSCTICSFRLGQYQKDDPSAVTGVIKRLYLDRCDKKLLASFPPYRAGRRWDCPNCQSYLGFAALYRREKRPAWYLLVDTVAYRQEK